MTRRTKATNYRHDHFGQPKVKALLAARRHMMDRFRSQILFICWREGAMQPASYHASEDEAREEALGRVKAGEAICILRASIVAVAQATAPVVTLTETSHD